MKDNIFVGGALTMAVLMLFLHLEVRTLLVIPWIMVTAVMASWYFAVVLRAHRWSDLWSPASGSPAGRWSSAS